MSTHVDLMDSAEVATRSGEEDGLGCLHTERGNLPLESIDVRTRITGLASHIEVTQGFQNSYADPLEATYIFPLPPRAAVTAMRMEADGRVVEGVLKERGEARASYDQAIEQGKRASIAEEERSGVFTMRVGNIQPGERVTVHVTLSGALSYEDGEATFRFPLVVAPRYIPGAPLADGQVGDGTALDTDAVPDASRITPPVLLPGFPNPVRLSMEVDIDPAGLPLAGVATSLHATATEESAGGLRILLDPGERADRDFLLRMKIGDAGAVSTSLAVLADDDGQGGTFALTVLPPVDTQPRQGRDVVLVLDRSGSMSGWKMIAARRAAARIVDTLGAADRLAVLAFDYQTTTPPGLPDQLEEANDRNRFRAVEFLAGLEARGGTEMLSPLRRAAGLLREVTARTRVLVLVTDGQVGNEDHILGELTPALTGVRVHTVGIDRAVNEGFLRRLAGTTGRCELVESEDRLDAAMHNIHRRIGSPLITELVVTPNGLAIDPTSIAPTPVPDLYPGAPVVVTGRYTPDSPAGSAAPSELPATAGVTVSGTPGWQASVTATSSNNPALAALWARARVRDLEDRYVLDPSDSANLERRIVDTSLRFGVLTRFTAFVAIDQQVVNEGGQQHRVTQPVELPSGWEMPTDGYAPTQVYAASTGYAPDAGYGMAAPASMPTFGAAASRFATPEVSHTYGSTTDQQGGTYPRHPQQPPVFPRRPNTPPTTPTPGTPPTPGRPPSIPPRPDTTPPGTTPGGTPPGTRPPGTWPSTTPAPDSPPITTPPGTEPGTTPPGTKPDIAPPGTPPRITPPGTTPDTTRPGSTPPRTAPPRTTPGTTPPGTAPPRTTPGTTPPGTGPGGAPPGTTPPGTTPGTTRPGTTPGSTPPGTAPPGTTPGTTPPGTTPGGTPPGISPPWVPPTTPDVPPFTPPGGWSPVVPGPSPVTQPPVPGDVKSLAAFATEELHRLQMNASNDIWLRAGLLTALAERIRVLLEPWQLANEPEDARTALGTLSTELSVPTADPTEVHRRWQRAISTLETLTTTQNRPRRAFWKR